jgi:hypothetical protein
VVDGAGHSVNEGELSSRPVELPCLLANIPDVLLCRVPPALHGSVPARARRSVHIAWTGSGGRGTATRVQSKKPALWQCGTSQRQFAACGGRVMTAPTTSR